MKGKCPERGTLLVKSGHRITAGGVVKVRCPSCTKHFHQLAELEWSK